MFGDVDCDGDLVFSVVDISSFDIYFLLLF